MYLTVGAFENSLLVFANRCIRPHENHANILIFREWTRNIPQTRLMMLIREQTNRRKKNDF